MILVFSVHADDAMFSAGEFIARQTAAGEEVVVASICSVVPESMAPGDYLWQDALNEEHRKACASLGAKAAFVGCVDGKWLERTPDGDVIERLLLASYLGARFSPTAVLVPLGIRHPDHLHFADVLHRQAENLCGEWGYRVAVYEDLPYRVMYPEDLEQRYMDCGAVFNRNVTDEPIANGGFLERKLEACAMYESQWSPPEGDAPRCVSVPERIWSLR